MFSISGSLSYLADGLFYLSTKMTIITRTISMLNFVITSTALTFQITVLYPWHKQLDESFEALKREHISVAQKLDRFKIHEGKSSSQEQVQVGDILKKEEL